MSNDKIKEQLKNFKVHEEWNMHEYIHLANSALLKLKSLKQQNRQFSPGSSLSMVFRPFYMAPKHINFIILGQDPYPNLKYATGLAFDIPEECRKNKDYPLSFEVLNKKFNEEVDKDLLIDLPLWLYQGTLPLNCSLTCEQGKPGSHKVYWSDFVEHILNLVKKTNENKSLVWLFLGSDAAKYKYLTKKEDLVIVTNHPASKYPCEPRFDLIQKKLHYLDLPF